jgi:hypothetical protein
MTWPFSVLITSTPSSGRRRLKSRGAKRTGDLVVIGDGDNVRPPGGRLDDGLG